MTEMMASRGGDVRLRLLDRRFLATMVCEVVSEADGLSVDEVAGRMSPTVEVSLDGEDGSRPFWDVRAFVSVPDGDGDRLIEVVVTVHEEFLPADRTRSIVSRAMSSGFGLLADELGMELSGEAERRAGKTYNIWLCVDAAHEVGSGIARYSLAPVCGSDDFGADAREYDLLSTVVVTIGRGVHSGDALLSELEGIVGREKNDREK